MLTELCEAPQNLGVHGEGPSGLLAKGPLLAGVGGQLATASDGLPPCPRLPAAAQIQRSAAEFPRQRAFIRPWGRPSQTDSGRPLFPPSPPPPSTPPAQLARGPRPMGTLRGPRGSSKRGSTGVEPSRFLGGRGLGGPWTHRSTGRPLAAAPDGRRAPWPAMSPGYSNMGGTAYRPKLTAQRGHDTNAVAGVRSGTSVPGDRSGGTWPGASACPHARGAAGAASPESRLEASASGGPAPGPASCRRLQISPPGPIDVPGKAASLPPGADGLAACVPSCCSSSTALSEPGHTRPAAPCCRPQGRPSCPVPAGGRTAEPGGDPDKAGFPRILFILAWTINTSLYT